MKVTLNPLNLKAFYDLDIDFDIDSDVDSEYDFLKPCIWICVRILGQKFLLVNQYPYSLLDSFNSKWVDNGNLTGIW